MRIRVGGEAELPLRRRSGRSRPTFDPADAGARCDGAAGRAARTPARRPPCTHGRSRPGDGRRRRRERAAPRGRDPRAAAASPRSPRRARPGDRPRAPPASSSSTPAAGRAAWARRSRRRECSRPMRAARPTSRARGAAAGTARETQPHNRLHLLGCRRLELDRLLVRQAHALVPRRVRLDPVLLEYGRQVLDALADRLALAAGPRELAHELVDVLDAELVDAPVAEDGDDAAERDAVQDARRLGDVDARRAPLLACSRDGWSRGVRCFERLGVGHARGGELAGHPPEPDERVSLRLERAGIALCAFAAAEPVLDEVAAVAAGGLPALEPDARHGRNVPGRRGRCTARRARDTGRHGSSAASSRGGRQPGARGRRRRPRGARARARGGAFA